MPGCFVLHSIAMTLFILHTLLFTAAIATAAYAVFGARPILATRWATVSLLLALLGEVVLYWSLYG